jgi:hypothetical protein
MFGPRVQTQGTPARRTIQRVAFVGQPPRIREALRRFDRNAVRKVNPGGTQHGKQNNNLHPPQPVCRQNIYRNFKFRVEESHRAVVWSWRARSGSGIVSIHLSQSPLGNRALEGSTEADTQAFASPRDPA